MTSWYHRMAFLQGRGPVSMTKPAPNWKWNCDRLSLAASALAFGPSTLFLNCHVAATIVPWNLSYLQELNGLLFPLNQCQLSTCTIDRWSCYSIQHCYGKKNVPTGVIFDQIFKFKTLLEASSLEGYFSFSIRHETTEWQMFIVHQRWHCALGQDPLSQHFGQLWTPAISSFLVSFTKPKQFHLVRNKLFPTMCLVWKSEEQQRFGGCSKSSTSGGRSLYACYGLPQSWHVRGRPGNALDNAGLPRCTHPDNNSASRLLQGLCNGVFLFKIGHKLTSNKVRKVGQVTVISFGVMSGEASANFERPSRSHFSLNSRQQAICV